MVDKNKLVAVSGANGFIGRHVVSELKTRNYKNILELNGRSYCDLTDKTQVERIFKNNKISYFIHLSALCGGISANMSDGPRFFTENMLQGLNVINLAAEYKCEKFVFVSTICAYPTITSFKEDELWNGREEITNRPYAASKKALHVLLESYQDIMPGIIILLGNSYGPYDNFSESGHVIPNIIKKIHKYTITGEKPTFFGNGTPTRTFTYVTDAACGIIEAFERYNEITPINIGSEEEISISGLVDKIAQLLNCNNCDWYWDKTLPNGQMKRKLNCDKSWRQLGFRTKISLDDGLKQTIQWYLSKNTIEPQLIG